MRVASKKKNLHNSLKNVSADWLIIYMLLILILKLTIKKTMA